jgi:ribulose-phosphate 3-epimerase
MTNFASIPFLNTKVKNLDQVSIKSVNPGFGGQSFIPETLNKIRAARLRNDQHQQETGREIYLEVDGGVKIGNIR